MTEIIRSVDWTPVLTAIIAIIGVIIAKLFDKYAVPWLKENHLLEAAKVTVAAMEAIFGRYKGAEKWTAALEDMAKKGFNIEADEVINALKAAWQMLDLEQHAAGIKQPEE